MSRGDTCRNSKNNTWAGIIDHDGDEPTMSSIDSNIEQKSGIEMKEGTKGLDSSTNLSGEMV